MEDAPIYVRIEEYRDVLDIINMIKSKMAEARETLQKIKEAQSEEDSEIARCNESLDVIEKKMDFIDRSLFEPQ